MGNPLVVACSLALAIASSSAVVAGPVDRHLATLENQLEVQQERHQRFIVSASAGVRIAGLEAALGQAVLQAVGGGSAPAVRGARMAADTPTVSHLRTGALGFQVVTVSRALDAAETARFIDAAQAQPGIRHVEPDARMQALFEPDDEFYGDQWHYFEPTGGVNLPPAWQRSTGDGVVVAVLDTGYVAHGDLVANLASVGYDFIADPDVSRKPAGRSADAFDPGDWHNGECNIFNIPQASSWHGTHVAGTVAAVTDNGIGVAGVAPDAQILPVRVLGKCGGFLSDIADGIVWAAGGEVPDVPDNPNPAQVINMSLGGSGACGAVYQAAIDFAVGEGTTVVVAAGNSNGNVSNARPANCDGVIAVASNTRAGARSGFSNFGDRVDITAPGSGVLSTVDEGLEGPEGDDYAAYGGTSMAAPHVAGIVALMKAAAETPLSPAEVESILKDTARPLVVPETCPGGCGAGIVDANAAVAVAQGEEPPPPPEVPEPPPPTPLERGVPVTGLAAATDEELRFLLEVPEDVFDLVITISGGTGDADLYVRYGAPVFESLWDCRPWDIGNDEICSFPEPEAGDWYVSLFAFESFEGVTLLADWSDEPPPPPPPPAPLENGVPVTGLSGAVDSQVFFVIDLPEGSSELLVQMSGGTGDADLYLRQGALPTPADWDCRPFRFGNNEECFVEDPEPGEWFVMVDAFSAYTGVTLVASWLEPGGPTNLALTVEGMRMRTRHHLSWEDGAESIDIYRNGSLVHSGPNTGQWSGGILTPGSASAEYQVCDAGTSSCSEVVSSD